MRWQGYTCSLILSLLICTSVAWTQATYTWTGVADTSWSNAANWTPARNAPANSDILVFDGSQTRQPTLSAKQTVGQVLVTGNINLRIVTQGSSSLTAAGGIPQALIVNAGVTLTVTGLGSNGNAQLSVGTNGGFVSGTVTIEGRSMIQCTDTVNRLVFQNGAVFNASQTGVSPFGAATANSVQFVSGAVYNQHTTAANPFGLAAPASVVIFDPGSTYNFNVTTGINNPYSISAAGRTYPNVVFGGVCTYVATGSLDCTVRGSLTVEPTSLFTPTMTGRFLLGGDIVNSNTLMFFGPAVLNGTSAQTISGLGFTSFGNGLQVDNAAGVTLQQPLTVEDTLFMTAGRLILGSSVLTLSGSISGGGPDAFIVTNGTGTVVDSLAAGSTILFPLGPSGTEYNPLTLSLSATDPAERFAVRVLNSLSPSLPDNAVAVQRTWEISEGTPGGNSALLTFQWNAADEGTAFNRAYATAWHHDAGAWALAASGLTSGSDPYTFATSSPVTGFSAFTVANGHPMAAISPRELFLYSVSVGQERTDSVFVKNTGSALLTVASASTDNAVFTVTPSAAVVMPSDSAPFFVTFRPTGEGPQSATLTFVTDGEPGSDSTVSLSGIGTQPGFFASPATLDFGSVWVDSVKTDTVSVTNTSTSAALAIDSVVSTNPRFAVTPGSALVDTMGIQQFAVTFQPTLPGPEAGAVIFYHNGGTSPDTVLVSGTGAVMEAVFSASHTMISFGNVRLGHSKSDTVTVANTGDLPLIVSSITSSDGEFQVVMTPDTVQAGDSAYVIVTFVPATEGPHADTIVFVSNAPEVTDTLFAAGTATGAVSIADARTLPNGTDVMVQGIVTRSMGAYTRIQDGTAAIVIYSAAGAMYDSVASGAVAMGDLLQVEGKTSEFRALKQIGGGDVSRFAVLSRGNPLPAPKVVTLAELDTAGELYESQLVQILHVDIVGTSDAVFNAATSYNILDNSGNIGGVVTLRIPDPSDTDADTVHVPQGTLTYTGVIGQFSSTGPAAGYQLNPVLGSDIVADPVLGVAAMPAGIPEQFALEQNFPNPFNPSTTIQYALPAASRVKVTVYSILGVEVATLVNDVQEASYYRIRWDGKSNRGAQVSSGIYFYRIQAEPLGGMAAQFVQVKRMILLK